LIGTKIDSSNATNETLTRLYNLILTITIHITHAR
jgi:hypothetical protein